MRDQTLHNGPFAPQVQELKQILQQYKQKPYLPFWGEIFNILRSVKKAARKQRGPLPFYQIDPEGVILYDAEKDRFLVVTPLANIYLEDGQLINALLGGSFPPR
jgi:hypothetical protein